MSVKTIKDHFGRDVFEGDEIVHSQVMRGKGLRIRRGFVEKVINRNIQVRWEDGSSTCKVWSNFVLLDVDVD